jgi:glucosylceramidase
VKTRLPQALRAALLVTLTFLFVACNASPAMTPINPPTNSTLPPNSIEVWLTLGDKSKLLSHEPNLTFTPGSPASGNTITVDANTLYQQFEGAGAAMTDSSAWLIMNKLGDSARQELMRNLFTREGGGIGISYLRIPMGASDFALQDYTYDDMPAGQTDPNLEQFSIDYEKTSVIPALKLAVQLNPQLGLLGSPWSPPAWMKKNHQFHGSSLLPEFYQAFADYHVRFVQAYAEEGLTIDAITPQNEPMHTTEGYPTMYMSPEDQQTFVRDHLGPAFQAAGLDTRIIIFDHNWDLVDYPLTVLSDPAAAAFVDGVAFHCYGGDVSAQSQVHSCRPS